MYSTIKNVQYVIATLKAYGIHQVVLSPGSRNAPLVHSFAADSFFDCTLVVDERSAAFMALGIIQKTQQAVAICCTSGSALLDYAPAVVEAYYQQLPLIVISADRPSAWINQMDGQTMVQNNALPNCVKKTVQLPEVINDRDSWFCERLLHDAILTATHNGKGPVHINVPITEPLFDFSATELPVVNAIQRSKIKSLDMTTYVHQWNKAERIMIVVGQHAPSEKLNDLLDYFCSKFNCVMLVEQLSNIHITGSITNFDIVLHNHKSDDQVLAPDLLIYFGGHIVSKRLKHFLRKVDIARNWRISEDMHFVDIFQGITDDIQCDPIGFFDALASEDLEVKEESAFREAWQRGANEIDEPGANRCLEFSDLYAVEALAHSLPLHSSLFVANSSVVRHMQLFQLDDSISVYCNRGINGIDGAISTAIGIAKSTSELVFLPIGDLSFFYDIGALSYPHLPCNLRILLLNNGGGAIFSQLPVPNKTPLFDQYVAADHQMTAKGSIDTQRIDCYQAQNEEELDDIFVTFVSPQDKPIVLEVLTDNKVNTPVLKNYYNNKKNK